jgi:hypothetical protein
VKYPSPLERATTMMTDLENNHDHDLHEREARKYEAWSEYIETYQRETSFGDPAMTYFEWLDYMGLE